MSRLDTFRFVIAIILFFAVVSSLAIPAHWSKRRHRQSWLVSFPFGLIAMTMTASITPFKKLSKITPQAMPSTILEARFSTVERYHVPRSSEPSDLARRFKVVDAALDDLIQILCRYLFSNDQRLGAQPGKLVIDQAKS